MCKISIWKTIVLLTFSSVLRVDAQSIDQSKVVIINNFMLKEGFLPDDIAEMKVSDQYYTSSLDVEHIYFQQYFMDIPIENAILNVGYKKDNFIYSNNTFVKNLNIEESILNSRIASTDGLAEALKHLGYEEKVIPAIKETKSNTRAIESFYIFDKGDISRQDIKVSLIWIKDGKSIRLCWESIIELEDSSNEWYHVAIDAVTGEFVKKYNLYVECNFDMDHCESESEDFPTRPKSTNNENALANSYNVFDLPVESPNHGSRTLTSTPWDRAGVGNAATTLGWHDDGGSSFTITQGNNTFAYEDADADNAPGYSPSSVTLDFNFPIDFNDPPVNNRDAAITNLFHTCNLIHDITYQYGFDEAAGNFQTSNLGRGGSGGDHVLAEAQDGGGFDNANFATPSDGGNGRMQMFLWSGLSDFMVNSPQVISGTYNSVAASFGPMIFNTTGNLVLVDDGSASPTEGCSPLTNGGSINGNIALIDRGNCEFGTKVLNAQNAGAIAAIVCNNVPGGPAGMGPGVDGASVTIPSMMISQEDCAAIRVQLPGVNITMEVGEPFDGSFDNGIIIHEYGHGISNRLTGGPSAASCLNNDEQMGEGWSDFFTLMLATDWSTASAIDNRAIGTYAIGQSPSGSGIRTYPYTTDKGVNPFTYADVATAPIFDGQVSPHYVGSIWATMLWDMTWNIINITPASTDIYHGTGGNNIAMQLVMDGLKIQSCSPGFVDGRDAILLADKVLYSGKYKCAIWDAFAGRGLGLSSDQGLSSSHTDGIVAFDLPDEGVSLSQSSSNMNAKEGEILTFITEGVCGCVGRNNVQIKETLPEGYSLISVIEGSQSGNQIVSSITNLGPTDTVKLSYQARADLCIESPESIIFQDDVEGSAAFSSSKLAGTGNLKWVTSTNESNSLSTSWYAQDYSSLADIVLTINSPVAISGPALLSFYHKYETEDPYDGGVVEISIDNGTTWTDLGNDFIENGYQKSITAIGTDSRIIGEPAFTGSSASQFGTSDFVKSVISLCNYDGENVLIRFRFVCDGGVGGTGLNGWYIDDIQIDQLSGIITSAELFENSIFQDDLSQCVQIKALVQNKLFVDNSALGNRCGNNWTNAYHSLQDAFITSVCNNIDTIFLAAGTYLPFNQRDTSYILSSDMVIMGGFPLGGGSVASRDPFNHITVLSGDIGIAGNNSDNNYHVVYCGAGVTNAVLDGIVIENGNANGGGEDDEGGAIYNLGQITLNNVIAKSNSGNSKVKTTGMEAEINIKGNTRIEN